MNEMLEPNSPVSDEELADYASRLESLPLDDAVWVARLLGECIRLRQVESVQSPGAVGGAGRSEALQGVEHDIAQVVLDAAEWLQTLWDVGYMGSGNFPAEPRSAFPAVNADDVLKSALLARIRQGRRPLPFPPPTRNGVPWHEVVEADEVFIVEASIVRDEEACVGAVVEGCADWAVLEEIEPGQSYQIQHQRKGPLYALSLDPLCSRLQRLPPTRVCRLLFQDRAGFRTYSLEWTETGAAPRMIGLRALSFERAEVDALHWIAASYPHLYGQVRFEHVE